MAFNPDKIIPKIQKPVVNAAVFLSAMFVVYSLIFFTDLFPIAQLELLPELTDKAQAFNKQLLPLAFGLLIISLSMYVYFTPKRRLFYTTNYITSGIFCLAATALSVYIVINVIGFRSLYADIDFEFYALMAEMVNARYVKSTFFFDIGIFLSALTVIACGLLAWINVYKFRLKRREKREEAGR